MTDADKKVIEDIMKQAGLERDDNNFCFSSMGLMFITMLIADGFGFPDRGQYQQGKIDAYEKILNLKGFDDDVR